MYKKAHPILITIVAILFIALVGGIFATFHQNSHLFSENDQITQNSTPQTPGEQMPYTFDYSWLKHPYVAHAMGGILGDTYTNSLEAFELNYQLGQRVFEVDLYLTSDNHLVATHDDTSWHQQISDNKLEFTSDNFLSNLILGKYHALDCNDLLKLLEKYPNVYFITDSKFSDPTNVNAQFTQLVAAAQTTNTSLLDRFIIQIYNPEMLDTIMAIYPWRSVIYTLYNSPNWTPTNVLEFAQKSGVNVITMWDNWVTTEIVSLWQPAGIHIAAHTVNNLTTAHQLRDLGVSAIYTDFLLP